MFDARKTGQRIAALRKENGMTQEELAEKLDVSPQAVSKWENGNSMPEVALFFVAVRTVRVSGGQHPAAGRV